MTPKYQITAANKKFLIKKLEGSPNRQILILDVSSSVFFEISFFRPMMNILSNIAAFSKDETILNIRLS